MGLRDANNQTKNLKQSMRYYHMAMKVLGRNKDIDGKKLMLFPAISNNMGNIYSHVFETARSQSCLNLMASVLVALSDDMDDAYVFFHLNVVISFGQEAPAAAAA
jgi:hypothetical protein